MVLLLLAATQIIQKMTLPIGCPEKKWFYAAPQNETHTGVSPRVLVLSNGPEFISDAAFPPTANHINLYWGKIPFEGKELKLRILLDHLIDSKSTLDNLDIRFCCGVKDGGDSLVKIIRRVSTIAKTSATQWSTRRRVRRGSPRARAPRAAGPRPAPPWDAGRNSRPQAAARPSPVRTP